ncbi:MAG: IPT/TIG domain-containing protein [Pyrinomonadaceae bacterium]
MALFEGKTPAERNKLILAIALGAIALISLSYMLFGGSSSSPAPKRTNANSNSRTTVAPVAGQPVAPIQSPKQVRSESEMLTLMQPVVFTYPLPAVPEPNRNIFAFYVKPLPPPPTPTPEPVPSPPPPPPLVVSSLSPPNVFARTGEFKLEVSGDKFTIASHIFIDDVEMPTRYISPQQLSANVPAQLVGNPGARQIVVRTPDGQLYSNPVTLTVSAPPTPNFTYIGIIGSKRYNDTAVLKDNSNKQLLNAQRGDVIGGRFRVTSISEREVALLDTNLKIKHTLPFTSDKSAGTGGGPMMGGNPSGREQGIPGIPAMPQPQPEEEQPVEEEEQPVEEENP